jgi:serine phosphatase RsbU (regulator of sigma subunit)
LLVTAGGAFSELKSSGGLLGLFKGEEFPTFETQLQPGDKILLYTDGVELSFQGDDGQPFDVRAYQDFFESIAGMPIDAMMRQIEARLDGEPGSLNPRDDLTILGFEVHSELPQEELAMAGMVRLARSAL